MITPPQGPGDVIAVRQSAVINSTNKTGGIMIRLGIVLVSAFSVLSLWSGTTAPAYASHGYWYPHGEDYAASNSSQTHIWVCDNERDGNGVRVEYYLARTSGAGGYYGSRGDPNGTERGCGNRWAPSGYVFADWCVEEGSNLCSGHEWVGVSRGHRPF